MSPVAGHGRSSSNNRRSSPDGGAGSIVGVRHTNNWCRHPASAWPIPLQRVARLRFRGAHTSSALVYEVETSEPCLRLAPLFQDQMGATVFRISPTRSLFSLGVLRVCATLQYMPPTHDHPVPIFPPAVLPCCLACLHRPTPPHTTTTPPGAHFPTCGSVPAATLSCFDVQLHFMNPPREGKALLVLDLDHTLLDFSSSVSMKGWSREGIFTHVGGEQTCRSHGLFRALSVSSLATVAGWRGGAGREDYSTSDVFCCSVFPDFVRAVITSWTKCVYAYIVTFGLSTSVSQRADTLWLGCFAIVT